MSPTIESDAWLKDRHFGIVIDAGSSGSRLQIYSWKDPQNVEKGSALEYTLPKVKKGTQDEQLWYKKVEPGLSSLSGKIDEVGAYLRPLLTHARAHVPPSRHHDTPLFLLATAGMRLLSPPAQAEILREACHVLSTHSDFKLEPPSDIGPCGASVRIITGEEEGLFGWIAVNYLMDGFSGADTQRTTYGFLDMGGASTQIAFEPRTEHLVNLTDLVDVRLRLLGGHEVHHKVFVTTWLGYGTNQARERYVGKAIAEDEAAGGTGIVSDPCLPKNLVLKETPVFDTAATAEMGSVREMVGTGSYEQCLERTSALLNKSASCPGTPCLMNGVHVPHIDFSVSHFIGVSEYWFSSEHIFGLGGAYDYGQYERAAAEFCQRDWDGIMEQHEKSRKAHRLGGDGEVEKNGKVVKTGIWGPKVELPRLQMQCFKAAWIANVLHEGIGLPRIVDPGGNSTMTENKITEEAQKKGLGKPAFQSIDTIGDFAISWTLGKMVLEASKEVPSLDKTINPLVDPIDIEKSPIKPPSPFFSLDNIENSLNAHLPVSMTRTSLGFSPFLLLAAIVVIIMLLLIYPARRQLRQFCLRRMRKATRLDSLEEGAGNGNGFFSQPSSSSSKWLRAVLSKNRSSRKTSEAGETIGLRVTSRPNVHRSVTLPATFVSASSYQFLSPISRAPSPGLGAGYVEDATSVFSSWSRNSSQKSLSTVVSRPVALSRINSAISHNGNGESQ